MGKHFALSLQLPGYHLEKVGSKVSRAELKMQTPLVGAAILGLGVLMVIVYLIQVNSFSTKGYEISTMQKKITQLREEQKNLEIQTAELQSLQRIQGDPTIINMVPVSSISYVQTTSLTQR